jgi:HAD superfamily hydrolase (TIGR01490 family)
VFYLTERLVKNAKLNLDANKTHNDSNTTSLTADQPKGTNPLLSQEQQDTKTIVAAFDFDGTITTHDSLLPFLKFVSGNARFFSKIPILIPSYIAYRLGLISNHSAKQQLLHLFLKHQPYKTLEVHAADFAQQYLPSIVRPEALARLRWHQAQGHRCILVSAGLELYLRPWAQQVGITDIICTRLISHQDGFTEGDIEGTNCFGPEKVKRLSAMLGPKNQYTLYAYGDSRGDRELLALADYAFYREMPAN